MPTPLLKHKRKQLSFKLTAADRSVRLSSLSSHRRCNNNTMKLFLLLLITILIFQVFAETLSAGNAEDSFATADAGKELVALHKKYPTRKINCNYACGRRCREASRKNVCSRACKACCARCHCVPPGTYGNKAACPCYASLRTHGHKPKCP
ncbi:gibberellin-regulated protein 9-like [Malania oleifera]|uniref:gibberellin-regulated protein 9-like n=1 Tax=Malania oleifera TaxID=397392 RepID=UPI0025ADD910|nr:gibberellin-regulated protein 9-like [Malania oleifera]